MLSEDGIRIQRGPVSTGRKASGGYVRFELSGLDRCFYAGLKDRVSDAGLRVLGLRLSWTHMFGQKHR